MSGIHRYSSFRTKGILFGKENKDCVYLNHKNNLFGNGYYDGVSGLSYEKSGDTSIFLYLKKLFFFNFFC